MDNPDFEVFLTAHRGLPRQGPGSEASTLAALELCAELPAAPAVLDIGCGPGMQTIALAGAMPATITAVDLFDEYLDQLRERARAHGSSERIIPVVGDMQRLELPAASFDLIWAEGSAYIMGVDAAMTAWRPLLRPRGYLAFSDLLWLGADRPRRAVDFWAEEYPTMTDVETRCQQLDAAGYELIGRFTQPESDWWDHYYTPLAARLPQLRERYDGDAEALTVVEAIASEIEVRRDFGSSFGYVFFVARRRD